MITFEQFSKAVASVGLTPMKYSENIFYVKPAAKGAGKVEMNVKSATFIVGSGSKHLDAITSAVEAAIGEPLKRVKGWTLFSWDTDEVTEDNKVEILMKQFIEVVTIVEQAVPYQAKIFPAKAPKAKSTITDKVMKAVAVASKPKTAEQIMRAAEIKAKNLATMKAVSAKLADEKAA